MARAEAVKVSTMDVATGRSFDRPCLLSKGIESLTRP